jgi:CarboxypepD_reg-like domain/TonB dependent receptor/TonB-dependent Receptor Plug Domain
VVFVKKDKMKSYFLFSVIILSSLLLNAQDNYLTQTIKGTVIDEQSGHVLSDVTVMVDAINPVIASITDAAGNFKLYKIPVGRQTIKVSFTGYEEAVVQNIEVTSTKEVILEIKLKERIKKLEEVVVTANKQKNRALNEAAIVSARQFSVDEAVRYAGTRNDPSRMAQNFAGVSGTNDARNDIVIRGNSPSGVLWRMDGIDIPNPNHFSTLGATGGPVSILNTNTLKNSDFLSSAFPSQYGNAIAGVFDLRMRDGNNEKYEYLGQIGFNGFELGAEGPLRKETKSSFLVNYRYSLIAAVQALGLSVGTGSTTPYYQDLNFKMHMPTKKWGTFDWFGLGGESHVNFPAIADDNLYASNDGTLRDRKFKSLTGVTGLTNTYFFNSATSGKIELALSGFQSKYKEQIVEDGKADKTAYNKNNRQTKFSIGYNFNKKFSSKNQLTAGVDADISFLSLHEDYIKDGDSVLSELFNVTNQKAVLLKAFVNLNHRFNDKLTSNFGLYYQQFTFNNTKSIEPRWNIRYQFMPNQSLSFGAGLHSQSQPLEVYFYQTKNIAGQTELTNKNLGFVKSLHTVLGYDINFSKQLRFKTELYGQYIYNAAVEGIASSFSMLNAGADFYFPDKTNLLNAGKGYNYGVEMTLEHFLHKGFYYLVTVSLFNSKYKGSDDVWRSTVFNSSFVNNILAGKEFKLTKKSSFLLDTKLVLTGGQRYTPFDVDASKAAGYVIFKEEEAYSLRNNSYWRWDLKFSYARNGRKTTQKWFIDFQNITNHKNIYVRTLNPKTGTTSEINQIGFFPNFNYMVTF